MGKDVRISIVESDGQAEQIEFLTGIKVPADVRERIGRLSHLTMGNEWVLRVLEAMGLSVKDIKHQQDREVLRHEFGTKKNIATYSESNKIMSKSIKGGSMKYVIAILTGAAVLFAGWLVWSWVADEAETKTAPLTVIQQGDVKLGEACVGTCRGTNWTIGKSLEVVEPVSTPEAPQQSMTVEHQRELGGK